MSFGLVKRKIANIISWLMIKLKPVFNFVDDMGNKKIGIMSAGIAYYALLAIFPAMASMMAVTLMVLDSSQVIDIMSKVGVYMPSEMASMLSSVLSHQAGQASNIIMAIISFLIALFGASGAMESSIMALNGVFGKKESRNFFIIKLLSITLTIALLVIVSVTVMLLISSPSQLISWGVGSELATILSWLRWPVMIGLIVVSIAGFFALGPDHSKSSISKHSKIKWKVFTPGVITAAVLWLLVTMAFFTYAKDFASLTQSYSIFAGIVALMIWFNLSATSILVGALVDSRIQRRQLKS